MTPIAPTRRPFHARFAFRMTMVAVLLAVVVTTALGTISYLGMRHYVIGNIQEELLLAGMREAAGTRERLFGIETSLRSLAKNTMVSNALLDTMGRNAYLIPFLEGFRNLGGVPVTISVTNHRGLPLSGPSVQPAVAVENIARVIDSGRGAAFIAPVEGDLLIHLVEPIYYVNTGTSEGAVIFRFFLSALFDHAPDRTRHALFVKLRDPVTGRQESWREGHAAFDRVVQRELPLQTPEILTPFQMTLTMVMDAEAMDHALDQLTRDYLIVAALTLAMVVVVSLLASHGLTARLRQIEEVATLVTASGSFSHRFRIQGDDEVESLGQSFNIMLQRLEQAYADLAHRAESELRLSAMRYQQVVEEQRELICRCLPDGALTFVNPAFCRHFGCSPAELVGTFWPRLFPEEAQSALNQQWERILHGGENLVMELPSTSRQGQDCWLRWSGQPLLDDEGRVVEVQVVGWDITERKEAEERLRESGERFRTVADFTYDWEYWIGPDGKLIFISPSCQRITGYTQEAFLADPGLMERIIHPDDRDLMASHLNESLREEEQEGIIDFRIRHRDGAVRWIAHGCRPVRDQEGRFLGRRGSNRDVTERKEAEARLAETMVFNEQIIAKSSVGIVVYHHQGSCILANEAAARIVGASQEQLLAQNFRTITSWRDNGLVETALESLALGQLRHREVFIRTTFGVETWLECQFTPLTLNGESHLLLLFADVSSYRQAQQTMALAKAAAEEANRAKSDFLANMSHEIRTPMNAILGMADLLWETPLAREQRKYVQVSRAAGETLMGIINDILDFSKIEAGRLELERIDFHLRDEVETVCEIMAPHAHGKGVELAWRIAPELPESLRGDPIRLRQILLNLLSNAVKFTEAGEVELQVAGAASPPGQEGVTLAFTVRDTGIGIPADRLSSIFESFVQVDRSTTRRFGGTGLGLAIVKRLVERMGGEVAVVSQPGQGSVFRFTACFRQGAAQREPLPTLDLSGVRALVVDDTEANRLVLREMLGRAGAEVVEVGDGQGALLALERAKVEAMPFHLLLLDVRMPGMDGFQVVECWRAAGHPGVPILMLTSDHRERHRERCAELGVRHYLVKPVRHGELLRAIAAALTLPEVVSQPLVIEEWAGSPVSALRILLVDDSDDNHLLVRTFLDQTAHDLDYAANGATALEKMKGGHYDLVLMDVQMPVMDGYTATRAWRVWEREHGLVPIPVLAMTAYAMSEDVQRSLDSGCDDHITKPIKKKTLFAAIDRHGGKVREGVPQGDGLVVGGVAG